MYVHADRDARPLAGDPAERSAHSVDFREAHAGPGKTPTSGRLQRPDPDDGWMPRALWGLPFPAMDEHDASRPPRPVFPLLSICARSSGRFRGPPRKDQDLACPQIHHPRAIARPPLSVTGPKVGQAHSPCQPPHRLLRPCQRRGLPARRL